MIGALGHGNHRHCCMVQGHSAISWPANAIFSRDILANRSFIMAKMPTEYTLDAQISPHRSFPGSSLDSCKEIWQRLCSSQRHGDSHMDKNNQILAVENEKFIEVLLLA